MASSLHKPKCFIPSAASQILAPNFPFKISNVLKGNSKLFRSGNA